MSTRFSLKFAPHLSLTGLEDGTFSGFCGPDPVAQATFAAEHGFQAVEDNFFRHRTPDDQARLVRAVARLGLEWGCIVGTLDFKKPTFASDPGSARYHVLAELRKSIATAKSIGVTQMTIMAGFRDPAVPEARQFENAVTGLAMAAELAREAGIMLCLEAINRQRYPDNLAFRADQAAELCRAVGSPALKVLFDVYHVVVEGQDPTEQAELCFEQIGTLQISDHPGRLEPGTGEIDFVTVLSRLLDRGFSGIIGLEHGCSRPGFEGARHVVDVYRYLEQKLGRR